MLNKAQDKVGAETARSGRLPSLDCLSRRKGDHLPERSSSGITQSSMFDER